MALASLAALGVAAVAGVQIAGDYFGGVSAVASAPAPAMMAMPVPVVSVIKKTLPIYLDYPGRIESIRSIALQARVSGYIDAQPAADGADVKSGDLLYKIDPRDLEAALEQANAQAQRDQASLEYAKANFGRGEELVKNGFVTKDAYDQRASSMHQMEAQLALDRAAIEAAKLNLGYTEIRAPFAGRLGRNQAAKGALVGPTSGALNTLVQLDPIYVAFNPSELDLAEIVGRGPPAKSRPRFRSRASRPRAQGRTDLPRQRRRQGDGHDRRARHDRQSRLRLAAGPVRTGAAAHQGRARRVHGAADGARLEPDGQIRLCGRRGRQGRAAPPYLGPTDGDLVSVVKGLSEGERIIVGNLQKIGPGSPVKPLPQAQTPNP